MAHSCKHAGKENIAEREQTSLQSASDGVATRSARAARAPGLAGAEAWQFSFLGGTIWFAAGSCRSGATALAASAACKGRPAANMGMATSAQTRKGRWASQRRARTRKARALLLNSSARREVCVASKASSAQAR